MKIFVVGIVLWTLLIATSRATEFDGSVLVRYENETDQINLAPRKRIRAIAAIGFTNEFNDVWTLVAQLRTGLKNKQNVPAITLHQITDQAAGDKDVYLSRLYAKAQFGKMTLFAGKIPWKTHQVTDLFWDRHLNPIGIHLDYKLGTANRLKFASFKPLDGHSNTIGHMSIFQYQTKLSTDFGEITLSPWLVDYRGDSDAVYAKKDTQFDNQFIRFSGAIKRGTWQFGTDVGWSVKNTPLEFRDEFDGQNLSYTFEIKHGELKNIGSYLTQLKYLHVERFAVVTEFAQNASSRFATSNFKGWDLRIRHRLSKKLWVGGRLSRTQRLLGAPEQGVRFRLETKYTF
ncbi:hypothetical protein [Paraglaciecola arctica]|uniref:hypothetical protein n=1 Tax=Paraglaciecola arctica TaxID=1128911 RepID=UPI001C0696C7|nr:hypothetical protein [Paraglaciecola arctica]MBU3003346.1 hypothetical protein [Paraglaciecola arctica]